MRTLEEVRATLQIAKLKEEDLQKTIHCLSFGENVSSADYCLMELDETLCKHIEAGQRYGNKLIPVHVPGNIYVLRACVSCPEIGPCQD